MMLLSSFSQPISTLNDSLSKTLTFGKKDQKFDYMCLTKNISDNTGHKIQNPILSKAESARTQDNKVP